jgi:hypothetical protein
MINGNNYYTTTSGYCFSLVRTAEVAWLVEEAVGRSSGCVHAATHYHCVD